MKNSKSMTEYSHISNICKNQYKCFFAKKNVVGVGLGYKIIHGFYTDNICITVFVSKKLPINNLESKDIIPSLFKGFKTDVIESGIPKFNQLTDRCRPVINGYSVGNITENSLIGTCGGLVSDKYLYILGNNHILANYNEAPLETPLLQPAKDDGGTIAKDVVGHLYRYIPIKISDNYVDCALCKVISRSFVSPNIALIGAPKGSTKAVLGEEVKKVGRTSELTKGKINVINATFKVYNSAQTQQNIFKDQIGTSKMTYGGDSGSLLLNNGNYVVGLCMGSTQKITIANDIANVLSNLKVTLVTS